MSSPSPAAFESEIGARLCAGDLSAAAAAAAACRRAWPDVPAGWLLGSIAALMGGQRESALALAEEWLRNRPTDSQCLLQKAECLLALGQREQALEAAEAAARVTGEVPAALDAIGMFLVQAAEYSAALAVYDRAIAAAPADASLRDKRAVIYRYLGHFDLAAADFQAALAVSPADPEALKGLAELRRQTSACNHIAAMEAALSAAPPQSQQATTLHFALAKSYEDLAEYSASWRHLSEGNRLERARFHYDPALDRTIIERIVAGFPQVEPPAIDITGESPIFIVGLPRSGTTLAERIIGRHSQVHAAGELPALSEAVFAAAQQGASSGPGSWLELASALPRLDGEIIAREYLARARTRRGDRPRFIDKQLPNFFYCPLILRAFPRARIVHLTRHPLATCYAIYKARFQGTFPFAYDLEELGEFYLGYRRLMAHWHQVLPGRILDVAYEDIVSALEPTTRRLLEYLGLPFEAPCLEFHRNPAPSTTASAVQVRQALYDSSLDQWRHYAEQLGPLAARLASGGVPVD